MKKLSLIFFALIFSAIFTVSFCQDDKSTGKNLVIDLWANLEDNNIEKISDFMAEGFQSIHQDGPRTKNEELKLITDLNLGDYVLTDFLVTREENNLIVSYKVTVKETIKEERYDKTSWRLDVFGNENGNWKWYSHANLLPLK